MCLAQNALGTAQKQVEVIVDTGTVAPGAPQVQVEEAELTLEAGHTATLHCSATGVVETHRKAELDSPGVLNSPMMMPHPGSIHLASPMEG